MEPIITFYENVDLFLIVAVRMLGFFIIMPIFAGQNVPMQTKIGLSLVMGAIAISTNSLTLDPAISSNIFLYATVILKEFFVGLIIGYVIYFMFTVFYYVGQLIDMQVGLSMANVLDPISNIQVPILGNFYFFSLCAFLLAVDGHHVFIRVLFESYTLLPIGVADIFGAGLMDTIMQMLYSFFDIGFRVALPVVGAILVLDAALGILMKTAPQLHIFSIGMPVKLLVGLTVIMYVMPVFVNISDYVLTQGYKDLMIVLKGMMP